MVNSWKFKKIPGIEPSHTCKCETSDRNVFGGRIELDGRGDRRCGDPRDREYCDRDGGLEPKTINSSGVSLSINSYQLYLRLDLHVEYVSF